MRSLLDSLLVDTATFEYKITDLLPMESLAFYLAQSPKALGPSLIVTESFEKAQVFIDSYRFWSDRPVYLLPSYDPTAYAGVQIRQSQVQDRLNWLYHALNDEGEAVFVAPVLGLLQKTLSPDLFFETCVQFSKGEELPPSVFEKLHKIGYLSSPLVEDRGQYSRRGGLVDIYSPQMEYPVRVELFDNEIESLRTFDPSTQRTVEEISQFTVAPAREVQLNHDRCLRATQELLQYSSPDMQVMINHLRRDEYSENLEYFLPLFHKENASALQYFQTPPTVWMIEPLNIETSRQNELALMQGFYDEKRHPLKPEDLFVDFLDLQKELKKSISLEKIDIIETADDIDKRKISLSTKPLSKPKAKKRTEQIQALLTKISQLPEKTHKLISVKGQTQFDRLKHTFESAGWSTQFHESEDFDFDSIFKQDHFKKLHFFSRPLKSSFQIPSENLAVLSLEHFLGRIFQKTQRKESSQRAKHLSFGELKENDFIIHTVHGVCQFKGLIKMPVGGVEAEFLSLEFKDKDKLFLPIYRIHQIHKYSSEKIEPSLDKLGGSRFANIKTRTKKRLREMAHDLVKLYAERTQSHRVPYALDSDSISDFFNAFPYQETEDQLSAIEGIVNDLSSTKPMDRLICGDVGFGKTEVAMRAAFMASINKKQVAVLAPTTVLTMQHFETFKKRFKDWPIRIEVVNRLHSTAQIKKSLAAAADGEVDILIGTHRLLSQDVGFKNLGLLVIDEEQKFGVKHKEKIRKLKVNVDTIALSATPIPRTLNMSLLKIRDLSLINTAPVDRLEIRTFICRYDKEIIKRAIETELQRGGQVFFLHNRVQSIYSVAEELRHLLPGVPIGVGHGQLKEKELESVMVSFFNNNIKVLVASSIVESGVDIPNANTILINHADNFGLSQLYQLRGRVGRSVRRAYCYLLTEPNKKLSDVAKERLRVIQENTKLGSGIQIAQYDLELRGAGTLLGEEQSGLVDHVGYEFYMQLLDEAIQEAKGEPVHESVEPDINLKIKAFIPSTYISNIRLRLSYYRALTQITDESDIDDLADELKDQFGKPPVEVINLLGLMLIRHQCMNLGVKDISSGKENLVLSFTDKTPLPVEKVIELTTQSNKKYSITPDNRLKIRMKDLGWPRVHEEVTILQRLCPPQKN
jgi:transcription-repair coupling factor (superfamily II helicase)